LDKSPDHKILVLCRDPESSDYGFKLLVQKYQKQVYWLIRRMVIDHDDTNDLVQETFIKVWKNLETFRGDAGLYTWIYRIACNEMLSFLKKKKLRYTLLLSDYEERLSDKLKDENCFSGDEISRKLQEAILKLPEKQRLVFNMKYFGDMKYEEMSEILGTSVGALKASFHIAAKKIEENLKNN
jgi:RNA polymerase sigma factor (sigma-70 family)